MNHSLYTRSGYNFHILVCYMISHLGNLRLPTIFHDVLVISQHCLYARHGHKNQSLSIQIYQVFPLLLYLETHINLSPHQMIRLRKLYCHLRHTIVQKSCRNWFSGQDPIPFPVHLIDNTFSWVLFVYVRFCCVRIDVILSKLFQKLCTFEILFFWTIKGKIFWNSKFFTK